MNRIQIDTPATFPFSTSLQLRITDINYGNHTGNQVFLELMHEARVRFLAGLGCGELVFFGAALIMSDAAIAFKSEIIYGDEVEIQLGIAGLSRVGFDIIYRINCARQTTNIVAATGKTGMICYDYNAKKVVSIPAPAIERLQPFLVNQ